jgi:hypothetical protein
MDVCLGPVGKGLLALPNDWRASSFLSSLGARIGCSLSRVQVIQASMWPRAGYGATLLQRG